MFSSGLQPDTQNSDRQQHSTTATVIDLSICNASHVLVRWRPHSYCPAHWLGLSTAATLNRVPCHAVWHDTAHAVLAAGAHLNSKPCPSGPRYAFMPSKQQVP